MKNIILTAFQKFDRSQSLGGILLFGATIIALIFANSWPGNGLSASLKVFLEAFVVIDDISTVSVTALFYSSSIDWMMIARVAMFIMPVFAFFNAGVAGYMILRFCCRHNIQTLVS